MSTESERLGQALDLLVASACRAHGLGGGGQLGEQHRSIVPRARTVSANVPDCVNEIAQIGDNIPGRTLC